MPNHSCYPAPRLAALAVGLVFSACLASAHPMGNFSVNHYVKITVTGKIVEIHYVIDMAEIPTFQEMRQFHISARPDNPGVSGYLAREEDVLRKGVLLECDGRPVSLQTVSRSLAFADGAGGLPTMKIALGLRGRIGVDAGTHKLSYSDNNFSGRAGWKEIVAPAEGVAILNGSASRTDRSQELSNYSSDELNSPPQQVAASFEFTVSAAPAENADGTTISTALPSPRRVVVSRRDLTAPASPQAIEAEPRNEPQNSLRITGQNTPRSRFIELISTQGELSFWVLLSAAFIAAGLGALHAMEPGHGKTVVAAYLVGSRGTARHAVLLGGIVTLSHMAGVYLLGIATLYASRYIVPERLYPWLGAISGLSVAGLGVFTFLKHWTGESGEHSHDAGAPHSHWFLSMFRPAAPDNATPAVNRALSLREICLLGVTGGIVPCPAALVVLLSAFSLHRIGFGLFLITAFSFGLAAVLVVVGVTMVYAKRAMASRMRTGSRFARCLPFLSSAFMIVLGVAIAGSALSSGQIWKGLPSAGKLTPVVTVILLGLFLGMRHSTDPDHVVAVSTIVSRQGSIKSSAIIGFLWGLGHTLTIFIVGSAIIVFGVVIPPRLGLSMEFCVAFMLILLGLLNLTGIQGRMKSNRPMSAGSLGVFQTLRPLVVGLVHGLAGSAAAALLVLSTIRSPLWSTVYLLIFGFGTMAGMMLMTAAISMPLLYTAKKFLKVNEYMIATSGLGSLAFGIFLVYQIGFVDGLFTSHLHWVPQ